MSLPSAKQLTDHGDVELIKQHGTITGKLLRLFGFNLNLAPVLDVLVNEKNDNSLKGRTYGTTSDQVVQNATAFTEAMKAEGILCCGKHYPGYSMATVDPHDDLPKLKRTQSELEGLEWQSFMRMQSMLDMIMVGHISYPMIDPSGLPASLSRTLVHKVLREQWHFSGCTITDDMDMGAIKTGYGGVEAAASAVKAGNDLMLVCHAIKTVPDIAAAVARVSEDILQESYARITALRERFSAPVPFSLDAFETLDQLTAELKAKVPVPAEAGAAAARTG
jgi:beta-N-acetylhexosaminidase